MTRRKTGMEGAEMAFILHLVRKKKNLKYLKSLQKLTCFSVNLATLFA